ncbi:atrial natriuretic peptide receptor 1-like [Ornithodoros turicata]|uniref:atrial natriuretic peptide receptor 1-like n=1 Tax=Ornithodoros turicata TaxID=34597 RepID=UPI0031399481
MVCSMMRWILFSASVIQLAPASYVFNATIVSIFLNSSELTFDSNVIIPAVGLAVQSVSRLFPHINFQLVVRNSSQTCLEHYAGALAAEIYYQQGATAFVGPGCSAALDHVGRMASFWNVPAYTAGGLDDSFIRKEIYTTLTRMSFSLDRISAFLITVLREFDWHHIAFLVDETSLQDMLTSKSIEQSIKRVPQYEFFSERYYFSRHDPPEAITKRLKTARDRARVFVILCNGDMVRRIMLLAHTLGMGNGDFVFLNVNLISSQSASNDLSWYKPFDRMNKVAKEMYQSLMLVRVRVPTSKEYKNFMVMLMKFARDKYDMNIYESDMSPVVAAFYDCVLMYGWSLNETLADGGDPLDGRALVRKLWNNTFKVAFATARVEKVNGKKYYRRRSSSSPSTVGAGSSGRSSAQCFKST